MTNWLRKYNNYFSYAVIFSLLNMAGIFSVFGARVYGDTERYLNVIHWIWGWQVSERPIGFLRPLGPILASPFEFLGVGAGLIVENIVFYFACAVLIFKIIEILSDNQRQAFIGTAFFVTATPVLEFGLSYLTDMGALFFYLFSIFLTFKFFTGNNYKLIPINGFLSGLGFLQKENGALGAVFWCMMILLARKFSLKDKFLNIFRFGIFFIIPIFIVQLLCYYYLNYTHIDWFRDEVIIRSDKETTLLMITARYTGQLFRMLGILWPIVLIGLWAEIRKRNLNRLLIYAALLPSSFSFLIWTTLAGVRAVFIFAPLGITLATFGWVVIEQYLQRIHKYAKNTALIAMFTVITAINYLFVFVNLEISFTDKVVEFLRTLY